MNNLKESLYHSVAHSHGITNINNPKYKSVASVLAGNLDLWGGKASITPQILIDCINNNSVWKELDEIRDFS